MDAVEIDSLEAQLAQLESQLENVTSTEKKKILMIFRMKI